MATQTIDLAAFVGRLVAEEDVDVLRVGTIDLRIPMVVHGNYFPSLLEPRRRAERALATVVQEVYVQGVSTRHGERDPSAFGHSLEPIVSSPSQRLMPIGLRCLEETCILDRVQHTA